MSTPTLLRPSDLKREHGFVGSPALDVPRNKRGQPYVVPLGGGKPKMLTRTTTFIDALDDKSNLGKWQVRQALIGAATKPELLKDVLELDPSTKEAKDKLNRLGEKLQTLAGSDTKRDRGTELHGLSELADEGKPFPADMDERAVRQMGEYMLATMDLKMRDVERFSVCPGIGTGGTADRVAYYAGPGPDGEWIEGWFIVDLKTGSIEYGGLKMPMQLSIYSRSFWYNPLLFPVDVNDEKAFAAWKRKVWAEEEAAPAYSPVEARQDWGIIIHLPSDGEGATLYWANLNFGWEAVQVAQQVRTLRSRSNREGLLPFWVPKAEPVLEDVTEARLDSESSESPQLDIVTQCV